MNSRAFERVLNVRTYVPPKSTVNEILQMTHGILQTPRVIPNLAPARTTASPQRERQTSQTGKGGAHDQDPLHHHHQTRETYHDQRIAPQHGGHDHNLREGATAIARANNFRRPKFESRYLAGNNQEYTSSHLAIQRRRGQAATGLVTRRVPIPKVHSRRDTRTALSEQPYTNPLPTVEKKIKKALMAQQQGEMQSKREPEYKTS